MDRVENNSDLDYVDQEPLDVMDEPLHDGNESELAMLKRHEIQAVESAKNKWRGNSGVRQDIRESSF